MKFIAEFINAMKASRNKRRENKALLDDDSINLADFQSNYSFRRIAIFGIILGLIAFFVPFISVNSSPHKSEIEQLLSVFTNNKNMGDAKSYSLFIFVQLNDIRFSEDLKIVELRRLIYIMPVILLLIPILYELNAYTFRKMANVSFIAMAISSLMIFKNMPLLKLNLGAYLLIISCVILLIDILIPPSNREPIDFD